MILADMQEKQSNQITLHKIDAKTARALFLYIYCAKTSSITEIAVELYKAAHMYMIKDLIDVCRKKLLKSISPYNAQKFLTIGLNYDDGKLKEVADKYIEK